MAGSTREWVDFFLKAGIPSDEAASYALIFSRNRIQKNMLVDLNKEYLRDMGITLLGDVIAILKHAKSVHEKNSRAFIMSEAAIIDVEEIRPVKPSVSAGSSSVRKLLDHYTKKFKEAEECLSEGLLAGIRNEAASSEAVVSKNTNTGKNIVRLKQPPASQKLEVPLQKKRRVLPEHEGGYKITMPKKTQQPVTKSAAKLEKNAVFARLGDGAVSSTTPDAVSKISSSIFARLGDVSSTSLAEEPIAKKRTLPNAGVEKRVIPTAVAVSMRADLETRAKETPVRKRTAKNFLRTRDLKMLKITTEFSDDDDVEAITPFVSRGNETPGLVLKKRRQEEPEEESSTSPSQKRVRFGGTSTLLMRSDTPVKPKSFAFTKHTIAVKKRDAAADGRVERPFLKIKSEGNIKTRIGIVRPTPAKPISKMVSDTMAADSVKKSVKNRIDLKGKGKSSVLDRLG